MDIKSKAHEFIGKHPYASLGMFGAGLGGLSGVLNSREFVLKRNPAFQLRLREKAEKKKIKVRSKEYNKLEKEEIAKAQRNYPLFSAIAGGIQMPLLYKLLMMQSPNAGSRSYGSYRRTAQYAAKPKESLWKILNLSGNEKTKAEVSKNIESLL